MTGLTLVDARRLVRSGTGLQATDALFGDPVLTDIINEAQAIAESEVRPPWRQVVTTVAVSSAEPDVTLPTDLVEAKALFYDDFELTEVSITDALALGTDASGAPQCWTIEADQIRLRPQPDTDYTLTLVYYCEPPVLVSNGDVTLMPQDLARSVIVPKACELVHLRQGDRVMADSKATAYAQAMTRLRRRARGSTRPMRVRIRSGSWI